VAGSDRRVSASESGRFHFRPQARRISAKFWHALVLIGARPASWNNLLGGWVKACYVRSAFDALVTPLVEGAASSNLRPFLFYGWRRSRSTNSLKEK
jgi:hypothetical protein